jgi:hypothetical protein
VAQPGTVDDSNSAHDRWQYGVSHDRYSLIRTRIESFRISCRTMQPTDLSFSFAFHSILIRSTEPSPLSLPPSLPSLPAPPMSSYLFLLCSSRLYSYVPLKHMGILTHLVSITVSSAHFEDAPGPYPHYLPNPNPNTRTLQQPCFRNSSILAAKNLFFSFGFLLEREDVCYH